MKKITSLVFLLSPLISFAQIDFGSPAAAANGGAVTAFVENWEAVSINPANLGWDDNKTIALSIANVGIDIQNNALTASQIRGIKISDSLTPDQRQILYNAMTAPGGLNITTTINWFAFSFHIKKIGGFAIALTDKVFGHAYLSKPAANVIDSGVSSQLYKDVVNNPGLLNNTTVAQTFQGTNIGAYHYRELTIYYAHQLFSLNIHGSGKGGASFENSEYLNYGAKSSDTVKNPLTVCGGIGIKPIWGLFNYTSAINNGENIEQGTLVYQDPNYLQNWSSNLFTANGRGMGIDLGLSANYKNWKLGASVIDWGKITWQNPQFSNTGQLLPTLDSLEGLGLIHNNTDIFKAFVDYNQKGIANQSNFTTELPTKFRLGLSYQLSKGISLSGDFVDPLNNVEENLENPYLAAGLRFTFFGFFDIGVGYGTEKGFGNVVPLGAYVNFIGGIDFYVATNDILAYMGNSGGHVLSASAGIRVFGF